MAGVGRIGYGSSKPDDLEERNPGHVTTEAARQNSLKGSPLRGALLALLLELGEPIHGYGLAMLLAERLGPAERVEVNSVYRMLRDFEVCGLVVSELREDRSGRRPPKRLYRATDLTEAAVSQWKAAPMPDGPVKVDS